MANMISQAGELSVRLKEVSRDKDHLVLTGQMGVWDSQIFVPRDEALAILRLMMRPGVLLFMGSAVFRALFHRKAREKT